MSDKPRLRVLIVDDEPLARQRLEDLLRREPRMEIVGRIDNGPDAVDAIRSLKPDLVFLDVQMPGKTGLDVVAEIGVDAMPPTIFVTAYHQHALKAFELAAVDYLVKPFDDERFIQALRRAEKLIDLQQVEEMTERLRSLLGGRSGSTPAPTKSEYAERIAVESRGQVRVISVEKIDYITASGPYAELHVGDKVYAIRERMQALEDRLDPRFFRIHRSAIVRLDRIDAMLHSGGGEYSVRLKNGTELSVSRHRRDELAERLLKK